MSSIGESNVETRLDQRRGGLVAVVTVNNPSRLNSMNSDLMDEFIESFSSLAVNAELRRRLCSRAPGTRRSSAAPTSGK